MYIHQFATLAQNESLSVVMGSHKAGLAAEMNVDLMASVPDATTYNGRISIDMQKGTDSLQVHKKFNGLTKLQILDVQDQIINDFWSPDYDEDVIVGAGSTVILE